MQGVSGSNPLGSISKINQSQTGLLAALRAAFLMSKRLNIIFCAPKCAPNSGKRLCWYENLAHIVQHWEVALFKDYIVIFKILNKDYQSSPYSLCYADQPP